jgi:NADH-quinone oxidoreductase subunit H
MLWTLVTLFFLSICGTVGQYLVFHPTVPSVYNLTEFFTLIERSSMLSETPSLLFFQKMGSFFLLVQQGGIALLVFLTNHFDRELRAIQDVSDIFFYLHLYGFDILYFSEPLVWLIVFFIVFIIPVFIIIAYSTLLERKLMGSIQRRQGPNVVGFKGLLQPLADGLKLLIKEFFWPKRSYFGIYFFAAGLGLVISLYLWFFLPLNAYPTINLPILLLFILAIQIVETYSLILAGWASNSKYALLGALRTTAQMISYELALSFILLTVVSIAGSLDLVEIVLFQSNSVWFVFPLFPLFGLFLCASLAETNRTPFDLPEAEAELVAGYNVEYSGMLFALFFLAEYANMAFLSTLISLFFLGGWHLPGILVVSPYVQSFILGLKTTSILFFFVWIRATLPRYRYDQLMDLGWKVFLPFTFSFFLFVLVLLYCFGALPLNFLAFTYLL